MKKIPSNTTKNPEEIMRVFANLLIDRFLDDKKNKQLKYIMQKVNINLEQKENYGTTK